VEYNKMRGIALRSSIMKIVMLYTVPQIHQINVVDVNTMCSACWVVERSIQNFDLKTLRERLFGKTKHRRQDDFKVYLNPLTPNNL
jgi:hypothetical protein